MRPLIANHLRSQHRLCQSLPYHLGLLTQPASQCQSQTQDDPRLPGRLYHKRDVTPLCQATLITALCGAGTIQTVIRRDTRCDPVVPITDRSPSASDRLCLSQIGHKWNVIDRCQSSLVTTANLPTCDRSQRACANHERSPCRLQASAAVACRRQIRGNTARSLHRSCRLRATTAVAPRRNNVEVMR